jgi:pyridoxamine 5'-phosphate oxidase
MIIFGDSLQEPFIYLKDCYQKAFKTEESIEALSLSTIDPERKKPYSRFVNIKYINNERLIFFSNYESNKAKQINKAKNVSCIFYWKSTQTQIRIEGIISKCKQEISDNHFKNRNKEKNALAISSYQSKSIDSYEDVKSKFDIIFASNSKLDKRPDYWGGYEIKPNYFEFWTGSNNRLNKREEFKLVDVENGLWSKGFLEP